MSELLPTREGMAIREGLVDYLRTTFALADSDAGAALQDFLEDHTEGIFKGPFLRLRLPFRPAEGNWREALEWFEGYPPYGHQAAAFQRLTSLQPDGGRPLPTLITTGTGSGKTEAFLIPILDHVLRAKRTGTTGMKALILYPMNALANDQAQRLAEMISSSEELAGVTAALYTGQDKKSRTKVTSEGLITDRAIIRDGAPDILLTNYKMLDQLLLRESDAKLWADSALSLQYLVLDEFHTYDGAQGTDVSMLLRRLGLALKSYWDPADPSIEADDWTRPLGRVTPVATSATMGDKAEPAAMLGFARTVFGAEFDDSAVITETRMEFDEWIDDAGAELPALTAVDVDAVLGAVEAADATSGEAIARAVFSALAADGPPVDGFEMLQLAKRLPLTRQLAETCAEAQHLDALVDLIPADANRAADFLLAYVAALGHVRAVMERQALSIDLHMWVRELTRIDRVASLIPEFRWSDDGATDDDATLALPAIYCRHCGRSGWEVRLTPVGEDLDQSDAAAIRRNKASRGERSRPLIYAPAEGEEMRAPNAGVEVREGAYLEGFRWLWASSRKLSKKEPADEVEIREGRVIPVLTHVGDDAEDLSKADTCPSCMRKDAIRFLGAAVATMLSVAVSTLFGARGLNKNEKKSLVFTDSVQDAAHRAGFVESRSHSLTLRSVIRQAIGDSEATLDQVVDRMIEQAGDDPHRRYRLLPPGLAQDDNFADFWRRPTLAKVPARVRARVRRRLLLDVVLEFGLQSRVGRTLELTGSVNAWVEGPPVALAAVAQQVLDDAAAQTVDPLNLDEKAKVAWVRGVLERMRERGAIEHEWFRRYQREDGNRYSIWGGRPRSQGMPAFPAGRAAPGYPKVGGEKPRKNDDLDPVVSPGAWYAQWTGKLLGIAPSEAAPFAKLLFEKLTRAGVVEEVRSDRGASIYQLRPQNVLVEPTPLDELASEGRLLACSVCRTLVPGTPEVVEQLEGAPCLVGRCGGHLERSAGADNFYRRLYDGTDTHRVVAREHTSQLPDDVRQEYEDGFKASASQPDAPNVLVATPTLEMGIDIGDLSTVILASLPKSVASYLQRVGRAGRLTGNALNLAFLTGRGDQLPRLGDPLSVINGEVRPPATYIDAEEILRRQYVASIADRLARDASAPHPRRASEAMNTQASDSYLRTLISWGEQNAAQYLDEFLEGFPTMRPSVAEGLRRWATPVGGPESSEMAQRIYSESFKWRNRLEQLDQRIKEIQAVLPELEQIAGGPAATDADKAALRTAKAALKLANAQIAQLRGEYWIGVLEEYGLFPNYTLIDDAVDLDVALSWIDPDTGEYQDESFTFSRGAALALRDFAPGATFYARGRQVKVDAVDLGRDATAIREIEYCPACGYLRDLGPAGVPCPRCGSKGISDVQQRIKTVELVRVSSAMRREESVIDDSRDDRIREPFNIVVSADVDPNKITRQWFVKGQGFGVRHLRDMQIQWTNLGRGQTQGPKMMVASEETVANLFRVCVHCGQVDNQTQANQPSEHRPWCPQRRKHEEDTRSIALSRTLVTEGLVVRLPPLISMGDQFAVPSLSAALQLGLRERIGGAPDHIEVEAIVDPSAADGTPNYDALLLHDVVPGGTGYLADLAQPEEFWMVLHAAWEVLRDCECANENRLACHRCLLPFAGNRVKYVSRLTAERHLRAILSGSDDGEVPATLGWELTDVAVQQFDPETQIEKKFRTVLRGRLEAAGMKVEEKPGPNGNRWRIRAGGERIWTLEPQQNLGPAKPDFVLSCNQPLPQMAIFCDGWRFHASPEFNRFADDALKREDLRAAGHVVVGLTWRDLEEALVSTAPRPPWFNADAANQLKQVPGSGVAERDLKVMAGGPIDLIIDWIQRPDADAKERVSNLTPLVFAPMSKVLQMSEAEALAGATVKLLAGGEPAAGGARAWFWHLDTFGVLARHSGGQAIDDIEVALVIDDRSASLGPEHKDAWNAWLSLSNALALRLRPTTITTVSLAGAAQPRLDVAVVDLPEGWAEIHADATELERVLLVALAERDLAVPQVGLETDGGIPLAFAWPDFHVAVGFDLSMEERAELESEGWQVVEAEADAIADALTGRSA